MDEYALIRVKNYTALAEYISAQNGKNRRHTAQTTPYEIGVASAANVESRRIRAAAVAGMITFDNAVKLLAAIAMIGLSLMLAYVAVYFSVGLCIGALITGHPFLAAALVTGGILLTYEGVQLVIRNRDKVGAVVGAPVIWIKNIALRLLRGFCRIFHIKLPGNNNGANEEIREEMEAEEAETPETPETAERAETEQRLATDTPEVSDLNRNTANRLKV